MNSPPFGTIKAVASVHTNTRHISAVFSHHESLQHHDMNNDDRAQITQSHTNTHTQIYTQTNTETQSPAAAYGASQSSQ